MKWLDTPPVTCFDVTRESKTELRLDGPTNKERLGSGVLAGVGAAFTALSLRMLRQPFPGLLKGLPLVFTAVGASMVASGGAGAAMRVAIDASATGVTFSWGLGPLFDRKLEVKSDEIEALEVTQSVHTDRNGLSTTTHTLVLVKRDGAAIPFETFSTQAQANLRKRTLENVTRG